MTKLFKNRKDIVFNFNLNPCKFCQILENFKNNKKAGMYLCLTCNEQFCHFCWIKQGKNYQIFYTYDENWINELPYNHPDQPKPLYKTYTAVCSFKCIKKTPNL